MSGRGLRSRFVIFELLAMVASGCGGQQASTAPTAVAPAVNTPSPAPSTRAVQLHIVGRVLDSTDKPVPGARITQWDTANTTTTDASGTFEMTARVTPQDRWFWVTVEKPGFETSELARDVDAAANTSLRLHQIRTIGAGESVQGVVSADDPACGYHWGYVCRRVRVIAPASGTLTAEITADGADLGVALSSPTGFPQPLERRISVPVKAGSEITIDVSAGFDIPAAARFTLNTALAP